MRIVNSARLWDNRKQKKKRPTRLIFVSFALLGVVIAGGIVSFIEFYHPSVKTTSIKPYNSEVAASTSNLGRQMTSSFLPEQDNLDILLMQKLFPPASPTIAPDCIAQPCLALTFDDGPDPTTTPVILAALQASNAHATFFLVGIHASRNAELVNRIALEGNEIGNHSWSHADFTKLTPDQMQQQIDQTQNAIVATGAPAPLIFRPPYGRINNAVRQQINLPIILWNVDPKDWKQTDANQLIQIAEAQAKPGGIVIFHDMHPVTATAVGKLIQNLASRYKLVTVSELLNLPPNTKGVFFGR